MLFSHTKLGQVDLKNRIAMAPMTRSRASHPGDVANEMMQEYYRQRATAGLIISEGIPVCELGRGYAFTPGIYTEEQVQSWKPVTQSVHDHGGVIFAQLWHVGRTSHPSITGGAQPISPSPVKGVNPAFGPLPEGGFGFLETDTPREMTHEEIQQVIQQFVQAAKNAIEAGFDGIELHGANGYLIEQFMHKASNKRTDKYGGSDENRIRFAVEVIEAVVKAIGPERTAIRLSPYLTIDHPEDDLDMPATCLTLLRAINALGIAYVHFSENVMNFRPVPESFRKQVLEVFDGHVIVAGRYTKDTADALLEADLVDLVAFGEPFIANPDLVYRFKNGIELNEGDRESFYGGNEQGLIDYPAVDPSVFDDDPLKQEAIGFIKEYYRKFDARLPIEAFAEDLDWSGFIFSSVYGEIRSEAEYQAVYAEICETFDDSVHQLEKVVMTRKLKDGVEVVCDVVFSGSENPPLPLTFIEVKGKVTFRFKRNPQNGAFKINRYIIDVENPFNA